MQVGYLFFAVLQSLCVSECVIHIFYLFILFVYFNSLQEEMKKWVNIEIFQRKDETFMNELKKRKYNFLNTLF